MNSRENIVENLEEIKKKNRGVNAIKMKGRQGGTTEGRCMDRSKCIQCLKKIAAIIQVFTKIGTI